MKSSRHIRTVFLILLLCGNFFLHTFVHHSSCCGSGTHPSVRSESACCIRPVSCFIASVELFCPVCAGMLTADHIPAENGLPIPFGKTVVFSAFRNLLSSPGWLRPSARAPPDGFLRHIG